MDRPKDDFWDFLASAEIWGMADDLFKHDTSRNERDTAMIWIVDEVKAILDKKDMTDENKVTAIRSIFQRIPKQGDTVHVVGIASWVGWTGKLVSADENSNRAIIEVVRKKSGKVSYPTSLANVRKGEYPQKAGNK